MIIKLRPLTLVMATLSTTHAWSGGFALNEQSIKSMGMAQAGRASIAADATTVYTNPECLHLKALI
jgi:long-chain fatty acid transport protein